MDNQSDARTGHAPNATPRWVKVLGSISVVLNAVRNASPMLHAALALIVLLVATLLAVYKPRGITPYGSRKQSRAVTGP